MQSAPHQCGPGFRRPTRGCVHLRVSLHTCLALPGGAHYLVDPEARGARQRPPRVGQLLRHRLARRQRGLPRHPPVRVQREVVRLGACGRQVQTDEVCVANSTMWYASAPMTGIDAALVWRA
jgi:hypothetical protein